MPLKIGDIDGYLTDVNAIESIYYAVDNGADIISMSWGLGEESIMLRDAIDYAYSQGVVLVGAAGNENLDVISYPTVYDNVIAVAATDNNDEKAFFSSFGSWVDVAAPGLNIYSTMPTYDVIMTEYADFSKNYDYCYGTSMACPLVAGVVALILSKNPSLNNDMVKTIINNAVDEIDNLLSILHSV